MAKQTWKPGNMLYPLPAVMVSVTDGEGNDNIITVAWAGTVCTNPPMVSISVRPTRFSYDMICKTKEFVLNLTTEELAYATDYCGVRSGREVDKFQELHLTKEKISERTQARGISSIKSFFKYLIEEEIREDNPSTLLEGPKLGLYLPDTLSFEDVEKIIKAIDLSTDLGVRNHCIIEVLYGCGLRVSELIELKISDVNFKENFIKVEGKGKKVR